MVCDSAINDWTVKANTCPTCGSPVQGPKREQTFCSMRCYRQAGTKRPERPPTPAQIRKRAAQIRSEWSRETLLARKAR